MDAPALSGADGNYDSQKVQAQWLVRSVLEAAWSKSLDKMMLLELADNPTVGDNHYRFSGLLTDRYVAKRSWFYIMTLKNILGEYSFDKEIVDGYEVAPGFAFDVTTSSGDDVRIYEFRNDANAITYAIWSPTAEAIAPFTVEIKFPKNPTGNFEYHLNGEATLYFIQELNEKGKRRDWSQYVDVVNNKITNIPVSETPVFLRLNKAYPSHPSIPHVTNLTCTPGCCNAVDLAWQYAGTGLAGTRNHLVFYREREPGQACPAFNFVDCTLFANYTGNRRSITVTGLEAGKEYCFYVIPIGLYGTTPDVLEDALSCSTFVSDCSGCLLNITQQALSYDPNWSNAGGVNPELVADVELILGITGGGQNACTDVDGPPCNPAPGSQHPNEGWAFWQTPDPLFLPEPNTFFINFSTPKKINSIYAQDWTGNGNVLIEYKDCFCPAWRKLTSLVLRGYTTSSTLKKFSPLISPEPAMLNNWMSGMVSRFPGRSL